MQVHDIMSQPVHLIAADATILDAAKMMADCDCGALPVADNDRLVGMLTDRDIVCRAVARGFDPQECFVREVMSPDIKYLYEDESIEDAAPRLAIKTTAGSVHNAVEIESVITSFAQKPNAGLIALPQVLPNVINGVTLILIVVICPLVAVLGLSLGVIVSSRDTHAGK